MTNSERMSCAAETGNACRAIAQEPEFRPGAEYVIDVGTLHGMLGREDLKLVDVRQPAQCPDGHIPGAVRLDYDRLVRRADDAAGLLPAAGEISALLAELGISPGGFVVAYDDGHGVEASRLLWLLEVVGHRDHALLNGGFAAWDDAELEISEFPLSPAPAQHQPVSFGRALAGKEDVLQAIDDPATLIVDTRSEAEYRGEDVRAARGGHIPGAISFNWESAIDYLSEGALKEPGEIRRLLAMSEITPDREIIVYCQTNRRSSHTFLVLKWLGFERVRAYAGSWSEWGNAPDLPVETEVGV